MGNLYRCDPDKNVECDKKVCYRHLRDRSGYFPCHLTTNKKYKMKLGKRIQEYRRDHLTCVQFDRYLKGLDMKKFHVNRTMTFNVAESKFYVGYWAIFRQDMTTEEYFSPANEAILDSDHNTVKDIRKLIKNERRLKK